MEPSILNKLTSGVDKTGLTELEKIFHLTTSISCCNTMNLYDENNRLKNFTSPEAILKYYYELRLHYYELRRLNLIKILEQDLFLLSTRARFILDVINDDVKVRNVPKANIIKQLEDLKYPKMVANGVGLVKLENMTAKQLADTSYGSYDFLIGMPIYNLTKEKVEELLAEKEELEGRLGVLKTKTDKDLWEEDLKIFESEYKKHITEYCDYMSINQKDLNFNKSSNNETKKLVMKKK
jgi:DNA topoisomerase-2